jgi:DNA-binding ferritin-like protein
MLINIDDNDLHLILKGLYKQEEDGGDEIAKKILSQINLNSSSIKPKQEYLANNDSINVEDASVEDILKNEEETLKLLDSMISKKNQILKNSKLLL